MNRRQRILYIQHTASLGGSCMSLLYLIQGLDRTRYEPVVYCLYDAPEVVNLYRGAGIETRVAQGIVEFRHTTVGWHPLYNPVAVAELLWSITRIWPSVRATEALVRQVEPDLVHLNSLVLAPSAMGVKRVGVPLVWHVREPVHPGHLGLRRRWLTGLMLNLADEAMFVSEYDRQQLTSGRKGKVIYNFVDLNRFDHSLDGAPVRTELGLPADAKVVLFLGGMSPVKGIFPLLEALHQAKQHMVELHCLIGGGKYQRSSSLLARMARAVLPLAGGGTHWQKVQQLLDRFRMRDYVDLLPFWGDVERLIAASDVVVFPSTEPHFARPVIEAGAMAKPVVASRIGGVEELVEHNVTGLLVTPGNSLELADALVRVLSDADYAENLGLAGLENAKRCYNAVKNVREIVAIYEKLIGD